MEPIALCAPVPTSEPPYYAPGPIAGVVRLIGCRWRPSRRTTRLLDVDELGWPHRAAAVSGLRLAMLAKHRRYMLRTASHAHPAHRERMRMVWERLERHAAQQRREAAQAGTPAPPARHIF